MEWGEIQLHGTGEAWRTRLVLVRMDPRRIALSLAPAFMEEQGWTVSDAGDTAALALDAGQFRGSLPWGWVVSGGKEILAPQHAPLAGAVVIDADGGFESFPRTAWQQNMSAARLERHFRATRCSWTRARFRRLSFNRASAWTSSTGMAGSHSGHWRMAE